MSDHSEDDFEKWLWASDDEISNEGGTSFKKGPWTTIEDAILVDYVQKNGEGKWKIVEKNSGLSRCGDSCRVRWMNHLRPDLKKCAFSEEEELRIVVLHAKHGNKWATIAAELPGRTDNDIKGFWRVRTSKLLRAGKPIYPSGIVPEHSTESGEYDMLYGNTSGSNPLDLQQEGNFKIPLPNLDVGMIARHYSLSGLTVSLPEVTSLCLPKRNCPSDSYNLSFPSEHPQKQLRQTETSFPSVNVGEMNEIPSVGQYVYSPEVVAEPLVVPPPQSLVGVSPSSSCFSQPLSDVPCSHSIGNYGNFVSTEFSFEAPTMELPSLQYSDYQRSSQSFPPSPFAYASHPRCLNQLPPSYPCQPVYPSPSGCPGLLEDSAYKEKIFPSLETGSSPQITVVSSGIVPMMDVSQSPHSPPGGNASSIPDTFPVPESSVEEPKSFDIDFDVAGFLKENADLFSFLNENEEPNDMDNSRRDE